MKPEVKIEIFGKEVPYEKAPESLKGIADILVGIAIKEQQKDHKYTIDNFQEK